LRCSIILLLSIWISSIAYANTPPFEGNSLFDLIGQATTSKPMQTVKQFLAQDAQASFTESAWFSKQQGLEIRLKYRKVVSIVVHGNNSYRYGSKPFVGQFPLSLQTTDTKANLINRIGTPATTKSWGALLYFVQHRAQVYYVSMELDETSQTIQSVFFKKAQQIHRTSINTKDFGGLDSAISAPIPLKKRATTIAATKVELQIGCLAGNCINGQGTYAWKTGSKYIGMFKRGQRNGFGTIYYNNGDIYVGEWSNNQPEGNGVYEYHSKGILKKYVGEWHSGKRTGYGWMLAKDGTQRLGKWQEGKFIKALEAGCLSGDCQNKSSEYIWADDQSRYLGKYVNGKRNGAGVYYYGKGGKYQGNFRDGKRHGYGTYYFPNGSKYIGNWQNDVREGTGTLWKKNGQIVKGSWKSGRLLKP